MSAQPMDKEAYSLQSVLRNGSGAVAWEELQRFITWLMCQPSRIKCPLDLRQGRPKAHNNVFIAVPYLDTDYLMLDLEKVNAIVSQSSCGTSLFRLKSPRMNLERGKCNAIEKLLIMDVVEQLPCTGRDRSTISDSIMRKHELPHNGYPSPEELEDLSSSSSEIENNMVTDISQHQILDMVTSNISQSPVLCKTVEDLRASFERYKHRRMFVGAQRNHDSTREEGELSADEEELIFTAEQLQEYATFVHHLKKDDGFSKMFAMDCEMVSSAKGSELARVTVVDVFFNVVLDSLVMPSEPITNYRTIYSGITEELLEGVTIKLEDVQDILGRILDSETILIGHSLNYDLRACKIYHPRVIDTAFMYRDPRTSSKHSLVSLAKSQLNVDMKREHGHDSFNDSVVTMYLAIKGILELCPFTNMGVDILSEKAFRILSNNSGTFSKSQTYIFDPMAKSYEDRLGDNIIVDPTEDDESSVKNLLERLKENRDSLEPCFYVLVLREFQLNCIRSLFQKDTQGQTALTKRLNAKTVSSYFTKLSDVIDRIAAKLEHNDVLMLSNLVGNVAQANILWRTVNTGKGNKANALMRLLKRIYYMVHDEEEDAECEANGQEKIPACVTNLHAKSQRIALSLLRREYETASRECELNWLVVLSKQVSGKRQPVSQEP